MPNNGNNGVFFTDQTMEEDGRIILIVIRVLVKVSCLEVGDECILFVPIKK